MSIENSNFENQNLEGEKDEFTPEEMEDFSRQRKETAEELKEGRAQEIQNRDEKGRFAEGSYLSVTPEQLETILEEAKEEGRDVYSQEKFDADKAKEKTKDEEAPAHEGGLEEGGEEIPPVGDGSERGEEGAPEETTEKGPEIFVVDSKGRRIINKRDSRGGEALENVLGKANEVLKDMSVKGRNVFEGMSPRGKNIFSKVCETLYNVPVINRAMGEVEISYNQFWLNRHESKGAKREERVDTLDKRINILEGVKQKREEAIERLEERHLSGSADSLRLTIRDLEKQIAKLSGQKEKQETKLLRRENKAEIYAQKRDAIADRLIGHYKERFEPIKGRLNRVYECVADHELFNSGTEIRIKRMEKDLNNTAEELKNLQEQLMEAGMSERKIKRMGVVAMLEKEIASARKAINQEREEINRRNIEMSEKKAKIDKKARPYINKMHRFERKKEGKTLKQQKEERKKQETSSGGKHKRETGEETKNEGGRLERGGESGPEDMPIGSYIESWNTYIQNIAGESTKGVVDKKNFIRKTNLSSGEGISVDDFRNLLKGYFRAGRILVSQKVINEYFK